MDNIDTANYCFDYPLQLCDRYDYASSVYCKE